MGFLGFCRAGGEKCPRNFRRGAVPIVEISGRVDGNRGLSLVKTSAASVQVVLTNIPSYFLGFAFGEPEDR